MVIVSPWAQITKTNKLVSIEECQRFDTSIHLFATNILVDNHNKFMLQSMNMPIARSATKLLSDSITHQQDDDQLEKNVLLCIGQ